MEQNGKVVGLAIKPERFKPMEPVDKLLVTTDGIVGGVAQKRHVTLIAREDWVSAQREVVGQMPWHTRRANILVEGVQMAPLVGKTVKIGDVVVQITGETDPCSRMDAAQPGLRVALLPDCRGGVHGNVITGGEINIGEIVTAE